MAKVQARCRGTASVAAELLARSERVPLLWCRLGKKNPHDKRGQVEEKNANRFAITTFSSC